MLRPEGLRFISRFKRFPEFALHFRCLEYFDNVVRPLMERRIPHHDVDTPWIRFHQLFYVGMKLSTGFTGGVKKLYERHLGIGRPHGGRIVPLHDRGIAGDFGDTRCFLAFE